MGIAVTGLLTSLTSSLRNAARLTEYDRASMLARRKMDEILVLPHVPAATQLQGSFETAETGGLEAGWKARSSVVERGPSIAPGARVLQRIELQVWWKTAEQVHTFNLETYRAFALTPEDLGVAEMPL